LLLASPATADIVYYGSKTGSGGAYVASTSSPITLMGIITETNFAALKIPANTIGKNGLVEVRYLWLYSNSANNKVINLRFSNSSGALAGGVFGQASTLTTTATTQSLMMFRNNNSTSQQAIFNQVTAGAAYGTTGAQPVIFLNVDTTQDTYVNLNGSIAAGGESLTLQHAAEVVYPAS